MRDYTRHSRRNIRSYVLKRHMDLRYCRRGWKAAGLLGWATVEIETVRWVIYGRLTERLLTIVSVIVGPNKVTRLTIFLAQRVISAWLRRRWVSTPLVRSTKQCPRCTSHRMVVSSRLKALIWVSCSSSIAGGISSSRPLFFDLLTAGVFNLAYHELSVW